jgi:preprotein translocase subunit SecE
VLGVRIPPGLPFCACAIRRTAGAERRELAVEVEIRSLLAEPMKKEDQKSTKPNASKREESNQKRKEESSAPLKDQSKQVSGRVAVKKPPEKKKEKGASIGDRVAKAGQFLREARTELKKVKWPTRKELMASTAVVIVLVLVVSFFLGIVDFGLIKIIKNIVG